MIGRVVDALKNAGFAVPSWAVGLSIVVGTAGGVAELTGTNDYIGAKARAWDRMSATGATQRDVSTFFDRLREAEYRLSELDDAIGETRTNVDVLNHTITTKIHAVAQAREELQAEFSNDTENVKKVDDVDKINWKIWEKFQR